jgi:ABC-type phosphate transport system ATPase subunit
MSQEELTSKVAMLSQEPPLLPVSIGDNICYGLKPGTPTTPLSKAYPTLSKA